MKLSRDSVIVCSDCDLCTFSTVPPCAEGCHHVRGAKLKKFASQVSAGLIIRSGAASLCVEKQIDSIKETVLVVGRGPKLRLEPPREAIALINRVFLRQESCKTCSTLLLKAGDT
jgi:hypothetical protein